MPLARGRSKCCNYGVLAIVPLARGRSMCCNYGVLAIVPLARGRSMCCDYGVLATDPPGPRPDFSSPRVPYPAGTGREPPWGPLTYMLARGRSMCCNYGVFNHSAAPAWEMTST